MGAKRQRTSKEYQALYNTGKLDVQDLWNEGFRPRSNKYRSAVKEYNYYKQHYIIEVTIVSREEYEEFKMCEIYEAQEKQEAADRDEYERFLLLKNKYAEEDM